MSITVEDVLEHFGVKGMKWGVRKSGPQAVTTTARPGRRVRAKGGARQSASADAIEAAVLKQVARKSTTDALSNAQLRAAVTRMQLEQQYSQLGGRTSRLESGKRFLKTMLGIGQTVDQAYGLANTGNIGKSFKSGGGFSGKVVDGSLV